MDNFLSGGEISYEKIKLFLQTFFGKFIVISLCWTFSFHILNELRHLFWDMGYGFNLNISRVTGILVIIGSLILAIILTLLERIFFNMISPSKKRLLTKISSILLIPLMIWFLLNFISIFDNDYQEIIENFFTID